MILTTVAGIGVLATFQECETECKSDEWVRLVSGIVSVCAACLSGIFTFFDFQTQSSKHKSAADDYNSMFRNIDTMLQVPYLIRGDPVTILQTLRSQYDDIIRKSPSLPERYNSDLTYKYVHDTSERDILTMDGEASSGEDEVQIDFELDGACSHNPTKAAYQAAELAIEQDKLYQKSLATQLQYELSRMDTQK